ncbi:MAG: Holliday junction resolvase RuvX [Chlamydiales bacterium]
MKRKVGIDYGKSRIGLSLESPTGDSFALPFTTVPYSANVTSLIDTILKTLSHLSIDCFVLGLPLLLSGEDSPICLEIRKFGEALEAATKIKVVLWDERLTTRQAHVMLKSIKMKRQKRDHLSDRVAASLILQSYLDSMQKELPIISV